MKLMFVEITMLCCALYAPLNVQPAKVHDIGGEQRHSACSLLKNAKALDGHRVVLKGNLVAAMESVRVKNKDRGCEIYVSFKSGEKEPKWRDWENAVYDQISRHNLQPVEVTLEGVFHRRAGRGPNVIAQLELKRVLSVSYLPSPPDR